MPYLCGRYQTRQNKRRGSMVEGYQHKQQVAGSSPVRSIASCSSVGRAVVKISLSRRLIRVYEETDHARGVVAQRDSEQHAACGNWREEVELVRAQTGGAVRAWRRVYFARALWNLRGEVVGVYL